MPTEDETQTLLSSLEGLYDGNDHFAVFIAARGSKEMLEAIAEAADAIGRHSLQDDLNMDCNMN